MDVRLTDGIEIDLATGERFVADASDPDGDVNFVSHAHGDHLYVTRAIRDINEVVEDICDVSFDATLYERHRELGDDDVLVLPSRTSRLRFVSNLVEGTGAAKVGFSGWATEDGYRFRADLDAAFTLSDHCDYPELLALVEAVDPDIVHTHRGSPTSWRPASARSWESPRGR